MVASVWWLYLGSLGFYLSFGGHKVAVVVMMVVVEVRYQYTLRTIQF